MLGGRLRSAVIVLYGRSDNTHLADMWIVRTVFASTWLNMDGYVGVVEFFLDFVLENFSDKVRLVNRQDLAYRKVKIDNFL
jgi:hypothetical protein